jgi:hypothetical protein
MSEANPTGGAGGTGGFGGPGEGWEIKCEETAGFLIPRPCRKPSVAQCQLCQKPICPEHTVHLATGEAVCAACAGQRGVGPRAQYQDTWDYYGYNPYFYTWGRHRGPGYTSSDYTAFDQPVADAEMAEQMEGS